MGEKFTSIGGERICLDIQKPCIARLKRQIKPSPTLGALMLMVQAVMAVGLSMTLTFIVATVVVSSELTHQK